MKVANSNARKAVQSLQPFKGNNLFAEATADCYAVYSYGKHFPIYACIRGKWYANADKYSVSTSKHQGQTHPLCSVENVSTSQLKALIGV